MTAEPTGLDAMRTDAVTAVTPAWAELSLSSHQAVCVAVLDGMVDMSHPCFSGAHLQLLGDPDEAPSEHGTHTASLIFGQPGTAVRGVAPSCRGLIIPTFRPVGGAAEGAGPTGQRLGCTQRDLAASIELAVERGAHIINISGGQIVDSTDEAAPELQAAVAHCDRVGTLIVAAAGNDGCDCLHVPAAMDPVLAVGAVDASGAPLGWSNFGHAYHANGVVAPGRAILGASVGGGVRAHDGTSCACAHVSGVAAVLVSLQHAQGQPLDPPAVRQAILSSVEPCDLHGTHDCRRALVGTIRPDHAAELIYSPSDLEPTAPQVPQAATGEEGMTDTRETKETTCSCGGGAAPSATSEVQQSSVSAAAPPSVTPSGRDEVPPATVPVSQSPGRRPWTGAPNGGGSQLVYFVGELGFNFASVTRLESFQQNMPAGTSTASDADVVAYLEANPWASSALIWTIGYESIPVYAVAPFAYEAQGYAHLLELMKRQLSGEAVRVSVPGLVDGRVDLLCGGSVPVIILRSAGYPELGQRGSRRCPRRRWFPPQLPQPGVLRTPQPRAADRRPGDQLRGDPGRDDARHLQGGVRRESHAREDRRGGQPDLSAGLDLPRRAAHLLRPEATLRACPACVPADRRRLRYRAVSHRRAAHLGCLLALERETSMIRSR